MPYGIFGILSWSFSTLKVIYTQFIRDYSDVKWKHDKVQLLYIITYSITIVGTTIYMCISCRGEWFMLLSFGQLSGWGFTTFSRGILFDRMKRENFTMFRRFSKFIGIKVNEEIQHIQHINNETEPKNEKERKKQKLNRRIKYFGGIIVFLSSICGWIATTRLLIYLYKIKGKIVIEACIIYIVVLISIVLALYNRTRCNMVFAVYFTVSLHIIGTCILIAIKNGHWIGIDLTSFIFIIGHLLSLIEELGETFFEIACEFLKELNGLNCN